MKVLFVDVGQGACQVIHLGDRRAIIIDTGQNPSALLRTLRFLRIETIELLVVSHSHEDHSGGAAKVRKSAASGVLVDYEGAIERVAFVYDSDLTKKQFGKVMVRQLREGTLNKEQLLAIEASDKPQELWISDDGQTELAAISPLAGDTLLALAAKTPNATSAVLELRHRGDRVIFTADSEISQWRDIVRLRALDSRLSCNIVTMPHHGGLMQGTDDERRWFFEEAIEASVVVVSVGTVNSYRHPFPAAVAGAANSGSYVMCTQITKQCCDQIESIRPGVIGPPLYPCQSKSKPDYSYRSKTVNGRKVRQRRSRNVACAGTIVARLDENGIRIDRLEEHRAGVDQLVASGNHPLCRQYATRS